jgi:hypothetical protein
VHFAPLSTFKVQEGMMIEKVLLVPNQRFVNREQAKQGPQIEEYPEKPLS